MRGHSHGDRGILQRERELFEMELKHRRSGREHPCETRGVEREAARSGLLVLQV